MAFGRLEAEYGKMRTELWNAKGHQAKSSAQQRLSAAPAADEVRTNVSFSVLHG
jgi:hypothetical protein